MKERAREDGYTEGNEVSQTQHEVEVKYGHDEGKNVTNNNCWCVFPHRSLLMGRSFGKTERCCLNLYK